MCVETPQYSENLQPCTVLGKLLELFSKVGIREQKMHLLLSSHFPQGGPSGCWVCSNPVPCPAPLLSPSQDPCLHPPATRGHSLYYLGKTTGGTDNYTLVPSCPVLPSHTMLEFHQTMSGGLLPLTGHQKREGGGEKKKNEKKKEKEQKEKKKIKKKAIVSDSFLPFRQ